MLGSLAPHTGEEHSWLKFKVTVQFLVCFILLLLLSFASFVSEGGCDLFCMEMEGASVAVP